MTPRYRFERPIEHCLRFCRRGFYYGVVVGCLSALNVFILSLLMPGFPAGYTIIGCLLAGFTNGIFAAEWGFIEKGFLGTIPLSYIVDSLSGLPAMYLDPGIQYIAVGALLTCIPVIIVSGYVTDHTWRSALRTTLPEVVSRHPVGINRLKLFDRTQLWLARLVDRKEISPHLKMSGPTNNIFKTGRLIIDSLHEYNPSYFRGCFAPYYPIRY